MIARDNHESDRLAVRVASRMHRPPGRSNAAPMCLAKQSGVSDHRCRPCGHREGDNCLYGCKNNGHHPRVRAPSQRGVGRVLLLQVAAGCSASARVSVGPFFGQGLPARHTADFWSIWGGPALDRLARVSQTNAMGTR